MNRTVMPAQRPSHFETLTLAPFREPLVPSRIAAALSRHPRRLKDQLIAQGLAPLWSEWAEQTNPDCGLPAAFLSWLKRERQSVAALYVLQHRTAARALASLTQAQVVCAFFKGAAIRERLYPHPSVRPAADLDILVGAADRDCAVRGLVAGGFTFSGNRDIISHEASLLDRHTSIDLHWGLFRPGRSRFDLTPALLATVRTQGGLPLLSDDANLLVMLVHPAFTKHVNGRESRLVRAVDLDRMLRTIQPDWDWILALIDAAGLRVAAWAVLHWQRRLMRTPVDPVVLRHLEPGRLQRRYLVYWLDRRLAARLESVPGLVEVAFTLALHEGLGDALRAIAQRLKARLESGSTLRHLQRLSQAAD